MNSSSAVVVDVTGSPVIQWGEDEADVRYTYSVVERIAQAGDRASMATDFARDNAEFQTDIRGAATMIGLVCGEDVVGPLRAFLLASRDHESETSERIIRAADGQDETARRAARVQAMAFSGRRGCLDSAVYMLNRGVAGLETVRAWEAKTGQSLVPFAGK